MKWSILAYFNWESVNIKTVLKCDKHLISQFQEQRIFCVPMSQDKPGIKARDLLLFCDSQIGYDINPHSIPSLTVTKVI